ncbi:MAG: glycoside hydrolase family 31 protein [Saprospiraceae bacterium]
MTILRNNYHHFHSTCIAFLLAIGLFLSGCRSSGSFSVDDQSDQVVVHTANYTLTIEKAGFKFGFQKPDGSVVAAPHPISGLQLAKTGAEESDIADTRVLTSEEGHLELEVNTTDGLSAKVEITLWPNTVKYAVVPADAADTYSILLRTAGFGPAYGMADAAAYGEGRTDLVLENFVRDPLVYNNGSDRMISNFAIYPKQGFAMVNMEPDWKVVRINDSENLQGSREVNNMPAFYCFLGTPVEIYQDFLDARNREGYPVFQPKSKWFGVGWEAFGALAWNTNSESVKENINQYLEYGYPLDWMVVGSGFWPRGVGEFDEHGTPYTTESASEAAKKLQATTSFGMWDKELYPDPKSFIDYFHQKGLIFTIGLRIGFIPGGPFTDEGLERGYFLTDAAGEPELKKVGFPRVPVYLLNSKKPEAVGWYVHLCEKWLDYGVDGFKEDLFHWPKDLPDDLIDPVNRALMEKGVYIMGRNNYLGSPADIHRYDDFNYNQDQDRGPINGLAYAFSGFPNVYPDIVGGTGLATGRFGDESRAKLRIYLIRYAQFASVNPSMAFGYGPWNFDETTNELCLKAAQLHHRLLPHIFSSAMRAYETGYPYPMTPLPLAYPQDPGVYGLADTTRHGYEWLIGESLLAAPLFGSDYDRSYTRDIYLPEGKWMDYDDGKIYEGPTTLEGFSIPLEKTPLFVGGTGFVVEQEGDHLVGRIYPLQPRSTTTFWHTDGKTKSEIEVDVADWNAVKVTDSANEKEVNVEQVRHAWQFVLQPGTDYRIN